MRIVTTRPGTLVVVAVVSFAGFATVEAFQAKQAWPPAAAHKTPEKAPKRRRIDRNSSDV